MAERWLERPMALLRQGGGPRTQKEAAVTLRHFAAMNALHRKTIVEAGAIPLLLGVLAQDDGDQEEFGFGSTGRSFRSAKSNVSSTGPAATANQKEEELLLVAQRQEAQEHAAAALRNLVNNCLEHQTEAVEAGALQVLVQRLRSRSPGVQEHSAGALMNLAAAKSPEITAAIRDCGMLSPLLQLLLHGTRRVMEEACGCIRALAAAGPEHKEAMISGGVMPVLVKMTNPGAPFADFFMMIDRNQSAGINRAELATGLNALGYSGDKKIMWRELDTDMNGTIEWEEFVNALTSAEEALKKGTQREGPLPDFIAFLKDRFDPCAVQEEAAGAIKNLVTGSLEVQRFAIDKGAVPNLVELLVSAPEPVQEQAEGALEHLCVLFAEMGVNKLTDGSPEEQDITAFQLAKVAAISVKHRKSVYGAGVVPALVQVMQAKRDTAAEQSMCALRHLMRDCPEHQAGLLEQPEALKKIVAFLAKGPAAAQEHAVHTCDILSRGGFNQELLEAEAFPLLAALMSPARTEDAATQATQEMLVRMFLRISEVREHRREAVRAGVVDMLMELTTAESYKESEEMKELVDKAIQIIGD